MIDTHAHLYLCKQALPDLVLLAREAGVSALVNVATDLVSSEIVLSQSQAFPGYVFPTAGIHPCTEFVPDEMDALREFVDKNRASIVAIGEIGLDLYRGTASLADQVSRFEAQLLMAREYDLPVIIHSRQSDEAMLGVILKYPDIRKVFHCFSSGPDFLAAVQHDNCYFSFTGHITYDNPHVIAAMKQMRLSQIMLETDCPYLTPKSRRGQANHSGNIPLVAEAMAQHLDVSLDVIQFKTTETARRFFGLS
jgi:TatD DNase family protein